MELLIGIGIFIVMHATELVGFILPPIVDILNRDVPDEKERFIVSVLVCMFAAILVKWNSLLTGSPAEVAMSASLIFVQSQVIFKLYFKDSFLRAKLKEKGLDGFISGSPSPSPSQPYNPKI